MSQAITEYNECVKFECNNRSQTILHEKWFW